MKVKIWMIVAIFLMSWVISGCKQGTNENTTLKSTKQKVVQPAKKQKTSSETANSKITSNVSTTTPKNQFSQLFMANNKTGFASTGQKIFSRNQDKWVEVTPHKASEGQNEFLTLYAFNEKLVWTADRANLYKSTDGGKTWNSSLVPKLRKDGKADISSFSFISSTTGWMLVHRGNGLGHSPFDIYQTRNQGTSWDLVYHVGDDTTKGIPDTKDPKSIIFIDENHGFLTGYGNDPHEVIFYKTNDGGRTWNQLNIPLPKLDADDLISYSEPQFFDQSNALLTVTIEGMKKYTTLIYYSRDQGNHWKLLTKLDGMGEVTFLNNKIGWANVKYSINNDASVLYQTKDGGKTWKKIALLTYTLQNLRFTSTQVGWGINVKSAQIMKSNDGGKTWSLFSETSKTQKKESAIIQLTDAKGDKFPVTISSVPIYEKYLNDQPDKKLEIDRSSASYLNLKSLDGSFYNILKFNCGNTLCSSLLIKISADKKIISSIELGYGILIDMKQSPNQENVVFHFGVNEGNVVMRNNIIPIDLKDMNLMQPKSEKHSKEFIEKATWPITEYKWISNNNVLIQTADIQNADYDSLLNWYKSSKRTKKITVIFKED
ncbi:hypothetical protein AN964_19230 [Heyndrickxia shackletonii]|uniref:Photosynthesis system II assembly factor Ycf48/Hcf136-like domain-containing protein n=2 Tax=Heyndrickxia shackletonii TaxID=157838 RepID=A0A0Q3WSJ5_9BACI|nr:hypothetical protein [Heyndrickxia shackletonii]KQL51139.1 hypothetical protein AN964_19230 [Heyndrickxia shackletonii]